MSDQNIERPLYPWEIPPGGVQSSAAPVVAAEPEPEPEPEDELDEDAIIAELLREDEKDEED